jgi:hypothetical protein
MPGVNVVRFLYAGLYAVKRGYRFGHGFAAEHAQLRQEFNFGLRLHQKRHVKPAAAGLPFAVLLAPAAALGLGQHQGLLGRPFQGQLARHRLGGIDFLQADYLAYAGQGPEI